jgi:nitroreductase
MDAIEALNTRRSIRAFTSRPVSLEMVRELIRAAMHAPSAGNEQPWHFIIITNREILDKIPDFHPYAGMLGEAPLAVLVCGDPRQEKHPGMWVQDLAAATQNLLLAAHAKGLGAVWVGVHPREDRILALRNLIELPEAIIPFALIPLGHPAEKADAEDRYRPELIHLNVW